MLSAFFAQLRSQQSGVRLIFSHGALNYRHQQSELSALLAPLKLRKREKKALINDEALINDALKPLFTYTLTLKPLFTYTLSPNDGPNDVHQAIPSGHQKRDAQKRDAAPSS
ncbi:hypothetical protein AB6D20_027890 (plasmid) [Vibrio splendidus]